MKIQIFVLFCFVSLKLAFAQNDLCIKSQKSISQNSKLYRLVDNLADYHVYYDSIEGVKIGAISDVVIHQECLVNKTKVMLIHFQTKAKVTPRSQAKKFYCYSTLTRNSIKPWRNHGTYCSLVKREVKTSLDLSELLKNTHDSSDASSENGDLRHDDLTGGTDDFSSPGYPSRNREDRDPFHDRPVRDSVDSSQDVDPL